MDYNQFEHLLRHDPRFAQLQADPQLLNDTLYKLSVVLRSGKVRDEATRFLRGQRDLDRYTAMAKRIAGLKPQDSPWRKSVLDSSLQTASDDDIKKIFEDDARAFYYQLDVMTGGKYGLYEKIDAKLLETNFERGISRSGVGCHQENGQTIWYINVDCAPVVNNRTVTMHELWHAIDEKNLYHNTMIGEQDQFIGEIGTLFIDRLSYDFMIANHSGDAQLIEGLKYLKSIEWNNDIIKGKEAFLDVLVCQAFYGNSEEIRNSAQQEILDGFGTMFGPNLIMRQINKLYDVVINPNSHFDPMYEFRYLVGRVVSDAVYQQELPLSVKVDKMAQLNDNVRTLNGIQESQDQSPIDAVTNFLGVDRVEVLMENYAQDMIQNRANQYVSS